MSIHPAVGCCGLIVILILIFLWGLMNTNVLAIIGAPLTFIIVFIILVKVT